MIDIGELIKTAESAGINMTESQASDFQTYAEILLEWNEKMNLTAITSPAEIIEKHFIDSLSVLKACDIKEGAAVVDVGTGAGFPGLPLKLMRPDLRLTLLDGMNKRLLFLSNVCERLGVKADFLHRRAEEAGQDKRLRESFDVAVSRAVAGLNVLAEYCIPLVKMKGYFLAMKGPDAEAELEKAHGGIEKLGGELIAAKNFRLPSGDARSIIIIRKNAFTPRLYPRHGNTIIKHPL